jgi:amidophosphoribosyltransferase
MKEKCAVFGVYGKKLDASRITYFGLYALQHRGQESSGISASDGKMIKTHKSTGLVTHVYAENDLHKLSGHIAIGHNRYSTSGGSLHQHTQPVTNKHNKLVLAHNGNLPITDKLKDFLASKKIKTDEMNDSELMHAAIDYYLEIGQSLKEAIIQSFPLFTGAFCLLVMTKDEIAAVRDEYGIRPLSLGRLYDRFF